MARLFLKSFLSILGEQAKNRLEPVRRRWKFSFIIITVLIRLYILGVRCALTVRRHKRLRSKSIKRNNKLWFITHKVQTTNGCSAHVIGDVPLTARYLFVQFESQIIVCHPVELIEWIHSRPLNVSILSESRKSNENVYFENVSVHWIRYLPIKSTNLLLFSHTLHGRIHVFAFHLFISRQWASGTVATSESIVMLSFVVVVAVAAERRADRMT